jgi:hypothetical protein
MISFWYVQLAKPADNWLANKVIEPKMQNIGRAGTAYTRAGMSLVHPIADPPIRSHSIEIGGGEQSIRGAGQSRRTVMISERHVQWLIMRTGPREAAARKVCKDGISKKLANTGNS